MKKVGIITLYYNNDNYGGVAQAYALVQFIKKQGYECEIINYEKTKFENKKMINNKGKVLLRIHKKIIKIINKFKEKKYIKYNQILENRHNKLEKFRKSISHSVYYNSENISLIKGKYDIYMTGSDQTFNPGVIDDAFTFNFLDNNEYVISYASSLAVDNFNRKYEKYILKSLKKYKYLSIREEINKKQLEDILNKKIEWVVDPTMLLEKEEWKYLIKEEKRLINEKYILTYILGDSIEQRRKIMKFAKEKKLKLVTIPFIKNGYKFEVKYEDINFGEIQMIDISFENFLSLIANCEYVITDSFHAVSFSYIFEKEFYVINRNSTVSMNSRIDSILKILSLENRYIKDGKIPINDSKIDYSKVNANAINYIERSKEYLVKALDIESEKDEN